MSVLHTIKARLYDNPLTKDNPNDFTARVSSEKSLNIAQICASAVTRGGAPTSTEAMEVNTKLFLKEMAYLLSDGYSINTGYFTASTEITGVFNSSLEQFNPEKHSVNFNFNQGSLLRKELENLKVEILGVAQSELYVSEVTDIKSGTKNNLLTPNRNLRINGYKIKVVGEEIETGVYFINQSTQVGVKVDTSDIVNNNPSEVMVVIPELSAGEYKLQITSAFSGNSTKPLKEARTTVFDKVLTVG